MSTSFGQDNALTSESKADNQAVPILADLFAADPDRFVARYTDIAALNLACDRGLPHADEPEFPRYLALLDQMAQAVRARTEKCWRLFKLKPAEFHHSVNVFRVFTMEHVLRTQFGVKYDPLVSDLSQQGDDARCSRPPDSTEVFIHGVLSAKRTGTCSSLPTFSIAVGRRLAYPLKLVRVPNHTFFRWDDGKEGFNHQHSDTGGEIKPDDYFYTWPRRWDDADHQMNARTKVWLHSLTPRQEVSKFLCNRAILLNKLERFEEALDAVAAARRFDPVNPACAELALCIQERIGVRPASALGSVWIPPVSHPDALMGTPLCPSGVELLDTAHPFRDRSNDPKHFNVRVKPIADNLQRRDSSDATWRLLRRSD